MGHWTGPSHSFAFDGHGLVRVLIPARLSCLLSGQSGDSVEQGIRAVNLMPNVAKISDALRIVPLTDTDIHSANL